MMRYSLSISRARQLLHCLIKPHQPGPDQSSSIIRNRVVLPAPLLPTRLMLSPFLISRCSKAFTTVTPPYIFLRFLISIILFVPEAFGYGVSFKCEKSASSCFIQKLRVKINIRPAIANKARANIRMAKQGEKARKLYMALIINGKMTVSIDYHLRLPS